MHSNYNFSFWIILSISLIVFFLFLYLLSPFFYVFCWSAILAFFIYPVYKFVNRKLKNKRRSSAILVLSGFICFVLIPLGLISVHFYHQITSFYNTLQPLFNKNPDEIFESLKNYPVVSFFVSKFSVYIKPYLPQIQERLSHFISGLVQLGFGYLGNLIKKAFSIGFQLAFTLITLYYFLIDGEKIVKIFKDLIPLKEAEKEKIFKKISLILESVLFGNILTGIIQGLLALIIYFILGIPQYLIWAFLTIIASFIPIFGTGLIWIPLIIYLLIKGSYIKALILLIYSALIISQIDNILKPILIGGKARIHNLLVFFTILGGLAKFGPLGLFLGPVILGLFLCVIEIYKLKLNPDTKLLETKES